MDKSLDNKYINNILFRYIFLDIFLANKLSLSLKKVKFSKQKFFTSKFILNIQYYNLDFQYNNLCYPIKN